MPSIRLSDNLFNSIYTPECSFDLFIFNSGEATCRDCGKRIADGLGIHRSTHNAKRSGFICISCFSSHLTVASMGSGYANEEPGFGVDGYDALSSAVIGDRLYSAKQIIDAVKDSRREYAENAADRILGPDASSLDILKSSESLLG